MNQRPDPRPPQPSKARLGHWCIQQTWLPFTLGSAILLLATVANVASALLFQPLFDNGIIGQHSGVLFTVVPLQMALLLARGVLAGFAFDMLSRSSSRLGQALTLKLFEHLQRHSLTFFLERPQSTLLQLLRNDVLVIELSLGQTAGQAIISTFQTFAIFAVIIVWEPRLAVLCIIGIGGGAALIWLASRLTNRALAREIEAGQSIAEHLLMMLGLRGLLLRMSSSASWGLTRLNHMLAHYRELLVRRRVLPNWVLVAGEELSTITYFAFYLVGAYLVAGGEASAGTLVAMAALISSLIGAMNQLAPTYIGLGDAMLRLGRLEQELAIAPRWRDQADALVPRELRGEFVLEQVAVRYNDVAALDGISITIRPGRITAIAGRSGAGKTTLTLLALGLLEPSTGSIRLDGIPLPRYQREALWRNIGYMPQEPILFRGSARENIAVGRPLRDDEIAATAAQAGIDARLSVGPDGYSADLGESGYRLSAGERQRLSLARALAGKPAVLVLDEPTANLDAATDSIIRETIVRWRDAGHTILVVTHSREMLAIADDMIVLDKGRIVYHGPADQAPVTGEIFEPADAYAPPTS